ncbi:conserved hypothetical protein [Methylobacterium sp. 4-46]|uniref:DUF6111 family protein n=1 Tax=unclassified Methylobacterium TaxID=2615210 RepID=UPI000165CD11|nr:MULTISPECIES: DUF6111 family protein [Methylobacterium]ACA18817.1 conserved hypothetical protein [Methylobacterium sp. 4-46]WFT78043.1 DUF6111 family protein [Methylobacterium nodulans]
MIRAVADDLILFFLPFALFGIYLVLSRRSPLVWLHWSDHALRLALAGAVLVVGSLLAAGLFAERHGHGFVPTHIENGRVVPGQFR